MTDNTTVNTKVADKPKLNSLGSVEEMTDYEILSEAIEVLHQSCMEQGEGDFLKSAMYHFHRLLNADYVIAGCPNEDGSNSIQTKIVLERGVLIPNMTYDLKGTPCAILMDRKPCVFPALVADLFPEDQFFKVKAIQSYVGAPLIDYRGNCDGIVLAVSHNKLKNPELALNLTKLFSLAIAPVLSKKNF